MASTATFQGESAILRRVLELIMTPEKRLPREDIFRSTRRDGVFMAYFLLDMQSHSSVETFITYTL